MKYGTAENQTSDIFMCLVVSALFTIMIKIIQENLMPKQMKGFFQDIPQLAKHIGSSTKVVLLLKNPFMLSLMNLWNKILRTQKKKMKKLTNIQKLKNKIHKLVQKIKQKRIKKIQQNPQTLVYPEIGSTLVAILKNKLQVTQVKT